MKLKLLFLSALISFSLYAQTDTESIKLVYDTSGYLENNQEPAGLVAAPVDPGDHLATVIPTVNAEMNVNEVGALTYMLPIEVLKGLNNFQPNLALVYSSQSGNGQAGYGWNITGTSMISRGGRSKEVDGVTIGPQFDNSDPFYLDGQRLLKVNDTDYVTEKFSKIKIQKFSSGEYSFIVKYTDGRIAKYKQLLTGQHYISVMLDAFDNEIHYGYNIEHNTPMLIRVSYGGTSWTNDKFFVNITYKNRRNGITIYRDGAPTLSFSIIDFITTSSTYTGTYRTYQLSHDYIENNTTERLRTITVSNENNEALKPVKFNYNTPSSTGQINYLSKTSTAIPSGTTGLGSIAMGDFFGRGEVEPIYQVKNSSNSYSLYGNAGRLNTSVGNKGNDEFFAGKILINNRISKNDQLITASTDYLGDFSDENEGYNEYNNHLVDRITFYINDLVSNVSRQVTVDVKGSTATHVEYDPYNGNQPETAYVYRDTTEREFISGDFNNDGLIDFLIYESVGTNRNSQLYLVEVGKTQAGSLTASKITGPLNNLYLKDPYLLEYDGDGIPEIMTVNQYSGQYSVYKIDLANKINGIDYNSKTLLSNQSIPNYISYKTPLFFGDFNGDGLTDFMTPHKVYKMDENVDFPLAREFYKIENEQLLWNKFISTGKTFLRTTEDLTSQKVAYIESTQRNIIKKTSFWQKLWSGKMDYYDGSEFSTNNIIVTDFNGDGRSDIIMINKIGKIRYSTTGNLRSAVVENIGNFLHFTNYTSWPFQFINFQSKIANRISYIQNISANIASTSTFSSNDNPVKPIDNLNYSPFTLIAPSAQLGQLNQYKSGVLFNDVLTGSSGAWVIDNDKFLEKQIQEVDNGSGILQKIEYRVMAPSYTKSEAPYYYNKSEADNFEYPIYIHNTNSGMYLAHKIHTEFDGKILTKEYRFENGVQHLEGKGFLGFQKTYVSDAYESEVKDGKYINKYPVRALFWNITIKDPLNENAVLATSYGGLRNFFTVNRIKNEKFNRGNHQYLILSTEEESIDYLKKITINKRYFYDPNDDFKLKKAFTDYDSVGSTESTYSYKPESNNGDHYFYGKIASTTQTTYSENLSFTTREETDYFPNGNVQENRQYGNDANAPPIFKTYTYDEVGNIKTQTTSTIGIASQTTTYEYDLTRRYVNKTTTPDGLFSESVVNSLGIVSEDTSALGLKTTYQYDSWGNIIKIIDYLGKQTSINKSVANSPDGAAYTVSKKREGTAMTIVTFDKFDREIQTRTQSLNNKWIVVQTEYDLYGRKIKYSEPFYMGSTPKWNSIEYDELNRPIKNISFTGKIITSCYEGMKVTVDDGSKKTSKTLDAIGNTVRTQDHGGVINFSYYPNGSPKETNYEGIKTTFEIDGWGNKKKIIDPSAGIFTYEYDSLNRIKKETTPKGYTLYSYDNFGRLKTENTYGNSTVENTTIEKTFEYDDTVSGKFLPTKIIGNSNGKSFSYTTLYDNFYRIRGKIEQTPEFTYTSTTTFDPYGRADIVSTSTTLNNLSYTTISSIKNVYDANGILIRQNDNDTGNKIWSISNINADGKMTEMEYGNGYKIKNIYNDNDKTLTDIQHLRQSDGQSIVDVGYDYDPNKGILKSRNNRTFGKSEVYTYDKLNRLLSEKVNDIIVNEYTYDQRGRITSSTELGKYNYNSGDYKLQSINFNANGQNLNAQRGFANVAYNAYRSPLRITLAGKDDLQFEYSILKTRYKMISSITGKEKLYSSDFAIEITKHGNKTEIITFINGDPYTANYIKKEILINGTLNQGGNYYLHRDNQGSILAITNASDGVVVEKRYFDAWGNLKGITNAQQQLITNNPQMVFMERGYTGHEHLQSVGLINMNARIYDPILRKFLSADNLVSDPFNSQAYDRYSYVLNNPLLYMDLDGNEPISFTAAVIIGVAVAVFSKAITNMISGIPFWYGMGKAATMGAVSAAVSFGIGSLATSQFGVLASVGKSAFEAGMHAVSSGLMSALDGGKFGSGFLSGMMSSLVSSGIQSLGQTGKVATTISLNGKELSSPVLNGFGKDFMKATMLVAGGLSGGFSATIAGGNFGDGLKQGLITGGLNHIAHLTTDFIQNENRQSALETIKKDYPRFYKVLSQLTGFLKENPDVLQTLADDTKLTKEQVLQFMDIKSPEGQIIKAAQFILKDPNDFRFGQAGYPKSYVNVDLIKTFEGLQTPAFIQGTSFLLAVTVLHEFVHWGRSYNILKSDRPNGQDYGSYWEQRTFGMVTGINKATINLSYKHGWKF